jgi:hypothetical protein
MARRSVTGSIKALGIVSRPPTPIGFETSGFGAISSPLVNPSEPVIDFADPLHPGSFVDIWSVIGTAYSDVPVADETWPTLPGPTATDYLPYSVSEAVVSTPAGLVPVNITFEGPLGAVPEPTTLISGALLLLPFGSSAVRRFRKKSQPV